MSRPGGPYDNHADQPPAGWPRHEQHAWLYPDDHTLDLFYEQHPHLIVFGGAGANAHRGEPSAPVDTRQPDRFPLSPPDEGGAPAAQLPDVDSPGGSSAGAV